MNRRSAVAVIDIGKSNAKLALVDEVTRGVIAIRTTANTVVNDPLYPHYDVERLWAWLVGGLAAFAKDAEITAISVTTHGACFVLLAGDRLALPVLDYEFTAPESVHDAYLKARGDFAETLSPDLPNGLNAGRQFFWQSRAYPTEFATTDAILPYPQYWAWRLTGAKAAEATSLGCHTDLWNPRAGTYSRLAIADGWDRLFPPLMKPWDTVGTLLPEVADATGLSPATRVVAGIHDSNASLLPHLLTRPQPFAVLSTGTWMVVFAPGGSLDGLDPRRDCLANVDAFGHAVPSSRFMAGREFETIAGGDADPTRGALIRTVEERTMALPTFAPGTGPYGASAGRWMRKGVSLADPSMLAPPTRVAAASLYAALLTETCLELAGARGPIIVEGPFAGNSLFLAALAQRVPRVVIARPDATGTTEGAALLAAGADAKPEHRVDPLPTAPLDVDLAAYAEEWRQLTVHP
jgi:sugar (pentulose or hexulose) kinase